MAAVRSNAPPLKEGPAPADEWPSRRRRQGGRRPRRIRGITPMIKVTSLTTALIACALLAGAAESQTLDARRLGMGGVVTSDVHDFSGFNIVFRVVPKGAGGTGSIPLPLGLIQYFSDHP